MPISALTSDKKHMAWIGGIILASLLILGSIFFVTSKAPADFVDNTRIKVPQEASLTTVSNILVNSHVISSALLFKIGVELFHGEKNIIPGEYLFSKSQNVWTIAYRFARGEQDVPQIKVTIPEGTDVSGEASIFFKNIPHFDAPYFIKVASGEEGYLFPDTYYFPDDVIAEDMVATMKNNFDSKIAPLLPQIQTSKRTLAQIIEMASIIEKEANTADSRGLISGILWKRFDNSVPLQVDSDKNTYKTLGLPTTPITNPGLDSIMAAINPVSSDYWYYLSDSKGVIHYAVTFDEHIANEKKYLK